MTKKAPYRIEVKFCTVCGRTDRHVMLGKNHFKNGKKCLGDIIRVRYRIE